MVSRHHPVVDSKWHAATTFTYFLMFSFYSERIGWHWARTVLDCKASLVWIPTLYLSNDLSCRGSLTIALTLVSIFRLVLIVSFHATFSPFMNRHFLQHRKHGNSIGMDLGYIRLFFSVSSYINCFSFPCPPFFYFSAKWFYLGHNWRKRQHERLLWEEKGRLRETIKFDKRLIILENSCVKKSSRNSRLETSTGE